MGNTFYFDWEVALMVFLQAHMGAAGVAIANFCSMFGEEMILILVMGFLYWGVNKKAGIFLGINFGMAAVWNPMIKNVALRRRPYFDNPEIKCLRQVDTDADMYDVVAQGYSFPSGHSSGSASIYGSIAVWFKKRWLTVICVILFLLVGISRFCVGVHYPTDVLCGWALGLFAIWFVPWLEKKVNKKWLSYLILACTAVPGFFYCKTNDFYSSFGVMLGLMVGNLFEEKFVNFQETKNPVKVILRLAGGAAIYFALNTLLKMPFSTEFLTSGTFAAYMVRCVRYFLVIFIDIGVYPMIFDKIGKKKA